MSALSSIWNRIFDIMWSLLEVFTNKRLENADEEETENFQIYIRTKENSKLSLTVRPEWNVGDVKSHLHLDDPSNERVKIIFQGKVLRDDVLLRDCDLGNHSCLDAAILRFPSENRNQESSEPLCETLKNKSESIKANFFVYCSQCSDLKTGKLRVRCFECRTGAIVVHRDPCSWEDVLIHGRITGKCERCNNDRNVEFYFKCAEHPSIEDDSSPPLYLIKSNNSQRIPCLACTDEMSDPVIVFDCHHVICIECFRKYCLTRLNERQFVLDSKIGYSLGCPANCPDSLIVETRHFRLLGQDQYNRYQLFATEEFVLQNGGVLCPRPGCGMGIMTEKGPSFRKVTCQTPEGCGFIFCRNCLQGFHISENCEPQSTNNFEKIDSFSPDPVRLVTARWENEQSINKIRIITKPCPNCRTPTEKADGCMHMKCTKPGCGFNWCWLCQNEWTRECMANHWFH